MLAVITIVKIMNYILQRAIELIFKKERKRK